jgi:hypothetical protein
MRTDLAQYYHSKKPSVRLQYMSSADEKVNFEINGTDLLLRDLNIYCTTKANHRNILEQMKQLAMSNNTAGASIYDLGNILKSDSIVEVSHILKTTEAKAEQVRKEEMQQQQAMQEQALQARAEEERMKMEFESSENEKDRQARILEAEIKASGYGSMQDINENKLSDFQDSLQNIQKSEQYAQTMDMNRQKETAKATQTREKLMVEREKIAAQKEIAAKQLEIAKENKNKYDLARGAKDREAKKKK